MLSQDSENRTLGDKEIRSTCVMPPWEFCCNEHTHNTSTAGSDATLAPHGAETADLSNVLKARKVPPAGSGETSPPRNNASHKEEDSGNTSSNSNGIDHNNLASRL